MYNNFSFCQKNNKVGVFSDNFMFSIGSNPDLLYNSCIYPYQLQKAKE